MACNPNLTCLVIQNSHSKAIDAIDLVHSAVDYNLYSIYNSENAPWKMPPQ
jgi:hypothetical protein